ncbi:MAG TPA: hypothetical protein VEX69_00640 [Candidatus Limnocylindria bacterium]|nr:hypothetical protein [Candidatus Limnocylindria bacterium]
MKLRCQVGLAAALFLAVPGLSQAQRVARVSPTPAVARPHTVSANPVMVHPGTNRGTANRTISTSATRNSNDSLGFSGDPLSVQDLLNPFPGFGFNFEHLSALNQDLGIKALIDPATQARLAVAERLLRTTRFSPGFFLLDGGGSYVVPVGADQQPQAQQPIIIVQQPAPQPVAEQPPPDSTVVETAAPIPDEGEFTLVLRSGKQLQAAAFTRMSDKIVYITPEGGRRTVAVGDLDSDATQRLNQERGVPLQLSL